jgi:hypothetical protein
VQFNAQSQPAALGHQGSRKGAALQSESVGSLASHTQSQSPSSSRQQTPHQLPTQSTFVLQGRAYGAFGNANAALGQNRVRNLVITTLISNAAGGISAGMAKGSDYLLNATMRYALSSFGSCSISAGRSTGYELANDSLIFPPLP